MPRSSSRLGRQTNSRKFQARLPQSHQTHRQAIRIPQSSRLECLNRTSRTGRPHEYLKAARSFASTGQVAPAGHTNTSKLLPQMPPTDKSYRRAIRIPQSSRLECLQPDKSNRQAIRIPQSCPLNRLNRTSQSGRPYEYHKAARSFAYNRQVAPAGHTNTSKLPAHLPQPDQSYRRAIRIPQSSRLECLNRTSRTGRPYEYLKVAGTNASNTPAASAGHTNTSKFLPQLLPTDKSRRQANIERSHHGKRILQEALWRHGSL